MCNNGQTLITESVLFLAAYKQCLMQLKEHNIHIMVEEERLLTEEEAKIFYDCKKDEASLLHRCRLFALTEMMQEPFFLNLD